MSRTTNVSGKQVYDDVTWKFEDLIKLIEVRHREDGPNIPQRTEVTKKSHPERIQTQHHPLLGKCYTFNLDYDLKQWGIGSIDIWTYVHIFLVENEKDLSHFSDFNLHNILN